MAVSSVLQPMEGSQQHYTSTNAWKLSHTTVRDEALRIQSSKELIVQIHAGESSLSAVNSLNGTICLPADTNGDGKCGLHAVFGEPNAYRELQIGSIDTFFKDLWSSSYDDAWSTLGSDTERLLLDNVVSSIWPELVVPFFQSFQPTIDIERPLR